MTLSIAKREHDASTAVALPQPRAAELVVSLASSQDEVRASQRLRYRIFAEEMGAQLRTDEPGLDCDEFDPYCRHIIVRDQLTQEVVASTRVLLDEDARLAGGFYSESEFDLEAFLRDTGRVMEIGRTCVHPDYRSGTAVSLLWSGLARFIDVRRYQYMIGCASVPMGNGGASAMAIWHALGEKYLLDERQRVAPRRPLPQCSLPAQELPRPTLPPLLKAYIRLGAKIGGEPCWDPAFDCADLFIVLSPADLQRRYARHFLER